MTAVRPARLPTLRTTSEEDARTAGLRRDAVQRKDRGELNAQRRLRRWRWNYQQGGNTASVQPLMRMALGIVLRSQALLGQSAMQLARQGYGRRYGLHRRS